MGNRFIAEIRRRFNRGARYGERHSSLIENVSKVSYTLIRPPKRWRKAIIDQPLHHISKLQKEKDMRFITP